MIDNSHRALSLPANYFRDEAMSPRCPLGESLHLEWVKALEQHTGYEELAMQMYFKHKNSCYECCGAKVYEMNIKLTPFLFEKEEQ